MKYLLEFKSFQLNEGGNAFPDAESIHKDEVEAAFAKFSEAMASVFNGAELELIGSWRQKELSGDLDCLFYSDLGLPEISQQLTQAGYETKIFYGFNIVSVKFGISDSKFVQFDMFVRPLDTNRAVNDLFYKSPTDERYSTKHRVFLIFCALDSMKFDKVERNGVLTNFKGYMLRPDGLYQFTKEFKKVNYKIVDRQKITDDLDEISSVLFGKAYPYSEWNTYEKTLALLEKNPKLDMRAILAEYREKLKEEGLTVPGGID